MHESIRRIIDVQKLSPWCARTPNDHFRSPGNLGLMRFAYEGRHDVTATQVEIVARTIKVGGHSADEVATVLLPVRLAEFEASDFCDGIPFVGGLKRPAQQSALGDRLLCEFWVDARRAEKEELLHAYVGGGINNIRRNREIVIQELGRRRAIRQDAANFRSRQKDGLWLRRRQPALHLCLKCQVDLFAPYGEDRAVLPLKETQQCRSHHAPVASHPYPLTLETKKRLYFRHRFSVIHGRATSEH